MAGPTQEKRNKMNILTDVLSLIRRGVFAEKAELNDVIVLGKWNETPDMTGVASPIPYKSVKVIRVRDFKVAAEHCDHANSPAIPAEGTGQVYQKTDIDTITQDCTVYFRSLKSMSSNLTLALSTDDNYVEITTEGEPNLAANVGSGKEVWKDKVGETLNFRTLVEGSGISIGQSNNELTISSVGGGGSVNSVTTTIDGNCLAISGAGSQTITTSGTFDLEFQGSSAQYINGEGILTTFPTISGMTTFLIGGDSGSAQNVYDGNTIDIEGGTGIETVGTGGPKVVINLDLPYAQYNALVHQSLTNAPTQNVLENDTGITITMTYTAVGRYTCTYSVAQDPAKVMVMPHNTGKSAPSSVQVINPGANSFTLVTTSGTDPDYADSLLHYTPLEIRIYP